MTHSYVLLATLLQPTPLTVQFVSDDPWRVLNDSAVRSGTATNDREDDFLPHLTVFCRNQERFIRLNSSPTVASVTLSFDGGEEITARKNAQVLEHDSADLISLLRTSNTVEITEHGVAMVMRSGSVIRFGSARHGRDPIVRQYLFSLDRADSAISRIPCTSEELAEVRRRSEAAAAEDRRRREAETTERRRRTEDARQREAEHARREAERRAEEARLAQERHERECARLLQEIERLGGKWWNRWWLYIFRTEEENLWLEDARITYRTKCI